MLDLFTLFSANGLAEELNKCRESDEYRSRGNIFNQDSGIEQTVVQTQSAEPTLVDAGLDMFNSYVSRMLGGLPDMSSFDLSMHTAKGKGQ